MKKEYLIIMIILLLIVGTGITVVNYQINSGETEEIDSAGGSFGEFVTTDLEGNTVDRSIFNGYKVNLINIWGTYCGPCIKEMPVLNKMAEEYKGDLQVIGICIDIVDYSGEIYDNMLDKAKSIVNDYTKVTYRNLVASKELLSGVLSDVQSIPAFFIVDDKGQILDSFIGGKTEEKLREIIEKYV